MKAMHHTRFQHGRRSNAPRRWTWQTALKVLAREHLLLLVLPQAVRGRDQGQLPRHLQDEERTVSARRPR